MGMGFWLIFEIVDSILCFTRREGVSLWSVSVYDY